MVDVFLALLYPPRCALCRRETFRTGEDALCRRCMRGLEPAAPGCERCAEPGARSPCARCAILAPPFASARACFLYRAGAPECRLRDSLLRWKYGGDDRLGRALCRLFAERTRALPFAAEAIVPVPLHRARLARRGFNQAALLARAIARQRCRPLTFALSRSAPAPSQTSLGRRGRQANVGGSFATRGAERLRDRAVLLVDDVITSGSTAAECSRLLLRAGARRVDVWALGRAIGSR